MTVMSLMTLALAAQTYNNPRQQSNDKYLKVTKVERTANSTILYLRYTPDNPENRSNIQAYPRLVDEATGKKYQATDALNFKWGTKYVGNATYKIEFPPLPRNTSVVTFREASSVEGPWVIKNIALPIQGQQSQTKSSPTTNREVSSSEYSKTYNNPKQSTNNNHVKVTKVIRTNEYTIVHFYYDTFTYGGKAISSAQMRLVDDDTEKVYKATKPLNFTNDQKYDGKYTFKVQFPPLSRSASIVRFQQNGVDYKYEGWRITMQLPR